jgi:hypothetical protein
MNDFSLTTPGLLFPAISLLMLAYTNRFLHLAALIRSLHARYQDQHEAVVREQIDALRVRVALIRNMQAAGVAGLLCCVACMGALFAGWQAIGKAAFGLGLVLMMLSLALSLREIQLSTNALSLLLADLDDPDEGNSRRPKFLMSKRPRTRAEREARAAEIVEEEEEFASRT